MKKVFSILVVAFFLAWACFLTCERNYLVFAQEEANEPTEADDQDATEVSDDQDATEESDDQDNGNIKKVFKNQVSDASCPASECKVYSPSRGCYSRCNAGETCTNGVNGAQGQCKCDPNECILTKCKRCSTVNNRCSSTCASVGETCNASGQCQCDSTTCINASDGRQCRACNTSASGNRCILITPNIGETCTADGKTQCDSTKCVNGTTTCRHCITNDRCFIHQCSAGQQCSGNYSCVCPSNQTICRQSCCNATEDCLLSNGLNGSGRCVPKCNEGRPHCGNSCCSSSQECITSPSEAAQYCACRAGFVSCGNNNCCDSSIQQCVGGGCVAKPTPTPTPTPTPPPPPTCTGTSTGQSTTPRGSISINCNGRGTFVCPNSRPGYPTPTCCSNGRPGCWQVNNSSPLGAIIYYCNTMAGRCQ